MPRYAGARSLRGVRPSVRLMTRSGAERGLVVVVMSLVLAACASGSANNSPSRPSSHPSAPFTIAAVPAGFELAAAERGQQFNPWGSDTFGTAEPFTVLARRGRGGSDPKLIVVSVTGFSGYEGGLDQAAPGRPGFDRATTFKVSGRRAIFTPAQVTTDGRRFVWSDLVVVRKRDLAVRVRARNATKAQLLNVFERVEASGKTQAPKVIDPPSGYQVVGSVDAGVVAVLNLDAATGELTNDAYRTGPGNPEVHRMKWSTNDRGGMTATTFPSRIGSVEAIPGYAAFSVGDEHITSRPVTVAGRRGIALEIRNSAGWNQLAVFTQTTWGNTVMVMAWGTTTPSVSELVAVAATIRPTSEATWIQEVPAPTSTPADR